MTVEEIIDTLNDIETDAIYSLLGIEIQAIEEAIEILEKFESGKMIELPCKVGDTVYIVTSQTSNDKNLYIREDVVKRIVCERIEDCINWNPFRIEFLNTMSVFEQNFNNVFLAREEAEKALKERSCK